MSKLINKTQGFTVVPNGIIRNMKLGAKERGILITLLSLPDNWNFSIMGLTKIIPEGKSSIRSGIIKLEELGYVVRKQSKNDEGLFDGYDWEIYSEPHQKEQVNNDEENGLSENGLSENPLTENRTTVNETQLNTNKSNTKELNTKEINKEIENSDFADDEDGEVGKCPFKKILELYNTICVSYRRVNVIEGTLKTEIRARWNAYKDLSYFEEVFRLAEASDFMKNGKWANLRWMMKPDNFGKILSHNYDNRDTVKNENSVEIKSWNEDDVLKLFGDE